MPVIGGMRISGNPFTRGGLITMKRDFFRHEWPGELLSAWGSSLFYKSEYECFDDKCIQVLSDDEIFLLIRACIEQEKLLFQGNRLKRIKKYFSNYKDPRKKEVYYSACAEI